MVECEGCGSQPMNDTVTISCDDEGYVAPPTPAPVPTRSPVLTSSTPAPSVSGDGDRAVTDTGAVAPGRGGDGVGLLFVCFLSVAAAMTGAVMVT